MERHPWEETAPRLLRHADNKIHRLIWRGTRGGNPPDGVQANDVVQTVLEKVLDGRRNWNPDKHPDLFEYLRDQVDSEISNLVQSLENRQLRPEASLPQDSAQIDTATPEALALARERERQSEEFFLNFLDFLNGETDLQQVVEAIVDGGPKPAEIAQQLGIRAEEVYSRRKRLARRLKEYQDERASAITPSKGGTRRG